MAFQPWSNSSWWELSWTASNDVLNRPHRLDWRNKAGAHLFPEHCGGLRADSAVRGWVPGRHLCQRCPAVDYGPQWRGGVRDSNLLHREVLGRPQWLVSWLVTVGHPMSFWIDTEQESLAERVPGNSPWTAVRYSRLPESSRAHAEARCFQRSHWGGPLRAPLTTTKCSALRVL